MLVLSRKKNQSIIFSIPQESGPDKEISISILSLENESGGKKVRLGIDAPKEIVICREEIYKEVMEKKAKDGVENLVNSLFSPTSVT